MKIVKIAAILLLTPLWAHAASSHKVTQKIDETAIAQPTAKENRIVKYTYSPEIIFRILTLPTLHTHIELGEDEGLKENPVVGDSLQWRVSGGPRNIYVKPVREDLETSLTLVTTKRTYQFQLVSGSKKSPNVYQKVSFEYPEREAEIKFKIEAETAVVRAEESRISQQVIAPSVDPASLNFNFDIIGEASFKPNSVYSDNKFTYIRMPSTQDMPAIFLIEENGEPSLINYKVKENVVIVERLAKRLLLKIGASEVKIIHKSLAPKHFWQ